MDLSGRWEKSLREYKLSRHHAKKGWIWNLAARKRQRIGKVLLHSLGTTESDISIALAFTPDRKHFIRQRIENGGKMALLLQIFSSPSNK